MNDPERLLEGGATPFERHLLDAAVHEKLPIELLKGMEAGLGLGAKTGAVAGAAAGAGVLNFVSVSVAVLGFGAVLAAYATLRSPAEEQPFPGKPAPALVAAATTAAQVEAAPAVQAPPASQMVPEVAPVARKSSPASKASAGDELRQELKLLDEARAALTSGSPSRARALLDRHARRFPNGSFRQEADVLRVEAFERLGERQKAATLAREFLSEHPESPHVERVGRAANSGR